MGLQQLDPVKAGYVLKRYGLQYSPYIFADSPSKAAKAAKKMGFPVVMKIASDDIIHKSDVGGVRAGIMSEQEVISAYDIMINSVRKKSKKARIKGIYLQKMHKGIEVIIGLKQDPQFGPAVIFGLGGIFVEILKDTSLRIAPINRNDALDMISEIKSSAILKGARGTKPANIDALALLLTKISRIGENKSIKEIDFNPVIVNEKSAVIVDARIIVEE